MCNIARIDAFLKEWPDAEFGPGHIVLSDANIEDGHIDWCIALLAAVCGEEQPSDEDRAFLDSMDWYKDQDRVEMVATLKFLREYRAVPEDQRVADTDTLCPDLEDDARDEPAVIDGTPGTMEISGRWDGAAPERE